MAHFQLNQNVVLFCLSLMFLGCNNSDKKIENLKFTWEINEKKPLEVTNVVYDNITCDSLGVYPGNIYRVSYGNGRIMGVREINSDSIEDGLHLEFHPEGTVYLSGEIRDGESHGHSPHNTATKLCQYWHNLLKQ